MGQMLSGGIPVDQQKLQDAAAFDKIQAQGYQKWFEQQTEPGVLPQAGQTPAQPTAPTTTAQPTAPAAEPAATPSPEQKPKGGEAEQPAEEDTKGKLVQIGGNNGPHVYENLWRVAQQSAGGGWASRQDEAWKIYRELLKGHEDVESKTAAAELKGQGAANIAHIRAQQSDVNNQRTNEQHDRRTAIYAQSTQARIERLHADEQRLVQAAAQKLAGQNQSNMVRLINGWQNNPNSMPPELQEQMKQLSHKAIADLKGFTPTSVPGAAQAPQPGQPQGQQGKSKENPITANSQQDYAGVPSGTWISWQGGQPFQKQ